jgi:hypothetical protein
MSGALRFWGRIATLQPCAALGRNKLSSPELPHRQSVRGSDFGAEYPWHEPCSGTTRLLPNTIAWCIIWNREEHAKAQQSTVHPLGHGLFEAWIEFRVGL